MKNNIVNDYKEAVIQAENIRQAREEELMRVEYLESQLNFVCQRYAELLDDYTSLQNKLKIIQSVSQL